MVVTTTEDILAVLQEVKDPEIPVISIVELGIIRDIRKDVSGHIEVDLTPTYSGCPAMDVIPLMVRDALHEAGYEDVLIRNVLSPAWTTEWITEEGKAKLREYGIAPPEGMRGELPSVVSCPRCNSTKTELVSFFGSTPCKAAYRCLECLEPFDYFKCH